MRPALLELLLQADDAARTEHPRSFDRAAAVREVQELARGVSALAGHDLAVGAHVEDASFFADLSAFDPPTRGISDPVLIVRFSAFGRLFTVMKGRVPDQDIERIVVLVESAGWKYVPYDEVDGVPYSGPNPHLRGRSWAVRFFDYL
jgi:hypothetical protein